MTIRDLIAAYVLADGDVSALIGTRLHPKQLPAKVTYPAAVIHKIDIIRPNPLRGVASLAKARIQFDVYCNGQGAAELGASGSDAVVDQVGAAIRLRLDGKAVTLTDTTTSPDSDVKAWIMFDLETEGAEPEIHGGLSRHTQDFIVQYQTTGGNY